MTNLTIISFLVDNIIKLLPFFKRKMSLREHQWKLRTKILFNAYETLYIYTRYCSKYLTHIISFSVQKHRGLFCRKVKWTNEVFFEKWKNGKDILSNAE